MNVSQEGGNTLTDSAAVEVVLSALMMAEHHGDRRWAFHVSATPLGEIPGFGASWVRAMAEDRGLAETVEYFAGVLGPVCEPREALRLKQLTHLAIAYQMNSALRLRDFVNLVREKRIERPQAAPVRVMTVHQAKGLEFDAVILPELDNPLTRQSGQVVADVRQISEPPNAMTRYLGSKSWHFLSRDWQNAFGRQAAGAMTEALCLLYVAMTRPRQAIYAVIQPPRKSDFNQRTAASLLYHSLQCTEDPTQGGATLFETGNQDWFAADHAADQPLSPKPSRRVAIQFRPLPAVAHRNRLDPE